SAVPSLAVARLCRPHVTVVLTGDGGDECFGGYQRYAVMRRLARLPALPRWRPFERLGRLADRAAPRSVARRAGRILQLIGEPPTARYARMMTIFSAGQLDA